MLGITIPANSVLCNGRGNPRWYRISNTFGYMTVEWPDGAKPPLSGVARVSKPLDHNCSCFPEIVRTGRYGAWRKGELAHESFGKVFDLVKELS